MFSVFRVDIFNIFREVAMPSVTRPLGWTFFIFFGFSIGFRVF